MKQVLILMGVLLVSGNSISAQAGSGVTCIASDGLTLEIEIPTVAYMHNVILRNSYSPGFLGDLIQRHKGHRTTDQVLDLKVSYGSCQMKNANKLICDVRAFGQAKYAYTFDQDRITVGTKISGQLSLKLVKDEQGIYQVNLAVTNTQIPGNHILQINRAFGPKIDPSVSTLTPWSPGCVVKN